MPPRDDWTKKLETSLQRAQEVIERTAQRHLEAVEARRRAASGTARPSPGAPPHPPPSPFDWLATLETLHDRWQEGTRRRREEEAQRRQRRAEEKRLRKIAEASRPLGFLYLAAALVFAALALIPPRRNWWLLLVAVGFGQAAATALRRAHTRDRMLARGASLPGHDLDGARETVPPAPAFDPAAAAVDARVERIDRLCERLLADLKAGPALLGEIVHRPEQTVRALRATCRELARREREIRSGLTAEDDRRLAGERGELVARIVQERDDVAKMRLGAALRSLDEQLARRAELSTAASRLEAESTRILYTLENLNTQILRVRTADAAAGEVAGAAIRDSLEQLGQEIDAVADALETVHRQDLERAIEPLQPVATDPSVTPADRLPER